MELKSILRIALLIVIIHVCVITLTQAQTVKPVTSTELFKEIKTQDSLLFGAFNKRDTAMFRSMLADNLEFFHDKGGLTGFNETMEFMRSTAKNNNGLRRELVDGTLEVYPIPGYGAMEIGSHQFCHRENGVMECAVFKFLHIWQNKNGKWQLTRVASYDHK